MKNIIIVDPGHGGKDSGAIKGVRYEKYDTLKIAESVMKSLKKQNIDAILTRHTDTSLTLYDRTNMAKKEKGTIFISLHRNAFTTNMSNGVEVWIQNGNKYNSKKLADNVLNNIIKVGVQYNRGVKEGNYHVTRELSIPSILVELGFITNDNDNKMFDTKLDLYADAIVKGVCSFIGIKYKI